MLYFVGLIPALKNLYKFNNDKPTSVFRDNHKGNEIISIPSSFPAQNLSHSKQYPEMSPMTGKSSLTVNYHFTALRNGVGKSIPSYNLKEKTPKCYYLDGKLHTLNEGQFY